MPSCESGFADLLDVQPRGWAMRHGHRKRLARETGRESQRGRAVFARSLNKDGVRWDQSSNRRLKILGYAERAARKHDPAWLPNYHKMALDEESEEESWDAVDTLPGIPACEDDDSIGFWAKAQCRELDVETASTRTPDPQELEIEDDEEKEEECRQPAMLRHVVQLEASLNADWVVGRAKEEEAAQPTRWELAETKAREARDALGCSAGTSSRRLKSKKTQRQQKPAVAPPQTASIVFPRVAVTGCPTRPVEHEALLRLAEEGRESGGLPHWWCGGHLVQLNKDREEYHLVEDYLTACLGSRVSHVSSISRVQLAAPYLRWPGGKPTVMFHGCKTSANEESILRQGFQVAHCKSGGANFGTWFAYDATYSHTGFAYQASNGEKHLFLCVVSDTEVRLDNSTMRVVPQGCAYPQWLVRYVPNQVVYNNPANPAPRKGDFWVVHEGRWVLERHLTGGR